MVESLKTAVILAAGTGSRLRPLTEDRPKCMVEVGGKPILAYTIDALQENGFERVLIVTGYKHQMLKKFVLEYEKSLEVDFIHNDRYDSTNNIFSLWLARERLPDGFMLIESDIILEQDVYQKFTTPDKIALDLFDKSIHSGTTATVNDDGFVNRLYLKQNPPPACEKIYKTVNLYSYSAATAKSLFSEIDKLVEEGEVHIFYEVAILNLIQKKEIRLEMISFEEVSWFEIDTVGDLEIAEQNLTAVTSSEKYQFKTP